MPWWSQPYYFCYYFIMEILLLLWVIMLISVFFISLRWPLKGVSACRSWLLAVPCPQQQRSLLAGTCSGFITIRQLLTLWLCEAADSGYFYVWTQTICGFVCVCVSSTLHVLKSHPCCYVWLRHSLFRPTVSQCAGDIVFCVLISWYHLIVCVCVCVSAQRDQRKVSDPQC